MLITSSRLAVEIAEPGSVYRRTRFDWTGFVTQVTLDGKHTFCVSESLIPGEGTGGIGLCNEFGIQTAPGYDDAKPGEQFVKPGVGLLTRLDEQPYAFHRGYPVEPFAVAIERQADRVRFKVEPLDCRGYAVRLTKTYTAAEDCLRTDYRLENLGNKPVALDEYCHNFVRIDEREVGPGYRLRFGFPVQLASTPAPGPFVVEGDSIRWTGRPDKAFYATMNPPPAAPSWWELVHDDARVAVRESDSFAWSRFAMWGMAHVISPEAFIAISLPPGQSLDWTREHRFMAL